MKVTGVTDVRYDATTDAAIVECLTDVGPDTIEIPGVMLATITGLGVVDKSIHHLMPGQQIPFLRVSRIETGSLRHLSGAVMTTLSLEAPGVGLLHFALSPQGETALRLAFQTPRLSS